jgi:hypothetical protein
MDVQQLGTYHYTAPIDSAEVPEIQAPPFGEPFHPRQVELTIRDGSADVLVVLSGPTVSIGHPSEGPRESRARGWASWSLPVPASAVPVLIDEMMRDADHLTRQAVLLTSAARRLRASIGDQATG